MQYRKEVDGLRSIAVLPVVLFHAGVAAFSGGYVGVDIFFVISGYLITSLILAEKQAGDFTIAGFYERRARRILPALFLVMLACLVPAWIWMSPDGLENFGQSMVAVSLFANNILLSLTSGYFDLAADEKPLLHTWSLGVEEQYYIVFPLLLALLWPLRRQWLVALLVVLALLSLGLSEWGWRAVPEANFYLPLTRAWELLAGALVAFAIDRGELPGSKGLAARNALSILGLALVTYSVFSFDGYTPFPSLYTMAPVAGTALVLYAADRSTVVGKLLSLPLLVGTGLISYSLYLWHQPLLAFARIVGNAEPALSLSLGLMIVAFALAYLTWRYVEKPFRNRGFMSRRQVMAGALVGSLSFVALGLAANSGSGYPGRMPDSYIAELGHIDNLAEQRKQWYEHGCQLSSRTLSMISTPHEDWHCQVKDGEAQVLVLGDSHAEDKAVALRSNGLVVDQVIGGDCSLARSLMKYSCRQKFDALVASEVFASYQFVVLANRWEDMHEVNTFAAEADYWQSGGARIVVFGAMPDFGKFADRSATLVGRGMTREEAARTYRYDRPRQLEIDTELRRIAEEHGFRFVDTADLFCRLSSPESCLPVAGHEYLVVDYAHLSQHGAKLLGESMIRDLQIR